ncbi:hypothetical protein HELRODRAFT_162035 [Helobdella robusta]|uniref:C-type lectin domain-containing protein n=1 Tax=Helobdella robusta TaxID=6412 RepID=T1ES62_HELRO|nr:hypothetical protein HELRODRAFT_162035 [Helobdella robusta]ESN98603.1 hypothetical protein HELRODRAFT_162035 [Helobdella robusta]
MNYWIGMYRLHCNKSDQHNYWLDGSDFNFFSWDFSIGEPNEDACCTRIIENGMWRDKPCNTSNYYYICKKPVTMQFFLQKRALKRLENSYTLGESLQVVQNRCSKLYCMSLCAKKWICAGFNMRPSVGGGCQCELKDARSWLTFPHVMEVGASYWSYPIYGYDKI